MIGGGVPFTVGVQLVVAEPVPVTDPARQVTVIVIDRGEFGARSLYQFSTFWPVPDGTYVLTWETSSGAGQEMPFDDVAAPQIPALLFHATFVCSGICRSAPVSVLTQVAVRSK